MIDLPVEYIDVPDRPGYQVIAIHLSAPSYWNAPFTYDNKPYMRIESTTVVMPREIFEDRLMRSKSNRYKWEDHICEGITIADLEEQRIRGGVRLGVERGRKPESSLMETTESLVEKLKLTTNGKLKNAAALFLRDTSLFPQFLLRMARFRGNDKMEFIDNQRAYGNFFTLLDAGMVFFFKHLSLSGKIVGFTREEKLEIPAEALREALTNAIIHCDLMADAGILRIEKHDDRLCFRNPGLLKLPVEAIYRGGNSKARNPKIQNMLRMIGFGENVGSGFPKIIAAWKETNWGEPQLLNKLDVDEVELVLPVPSTKSSGAGVSEGVSNRVPNGVSDTAKTIYAHIKDNPNITRNDLANLTGISLKNVQKHINRLKELGFIRRIGSTRLGYWEIIK